MIDSTWEDQPVDCVLVKLVKKVSRNQVDLVSLGAATGHIQHAV